MKKTMSDTRWMEAIKRWRKLPLEERRRHHLKAIPRHVANSMAMEGDPVDEAWIRERLARRISRRATLRVSIVASVHWPLSITACPAQCLDVSKSRNS